MTGYTLDTDQPRRPYGKFMISIDLILDFDKGESPNMLHKLKEQMTQKALVLAEGNITHAASALGMSIRTIRHYINQYNLEQFVSPRSREIRDAIRNNK